MSDRSQELVPPPPEVGQMVAAIGTSIDRLGKHPQWSEPLLHELRYKLGLPVASRPISKAEIQGLAAVAYERFRDPAQVYARAREFVLQQSAGLTGRISEEQANVTAAFLAALYYHRFDGFANGHMDIAFYTPGVFSPALKYEPGTVPGIRVPNIRTPFYGDRPMRLPSRYEGEPRWLRDVDEYPHYHGEQLDGRIRRRLAGRDGPVRVFDDGRGDAYVLGKLRDRFGTAVETYGLGLEMVTFADRPIDHDVIGPAEVLPADWTARMDIVVSNVAQEYFTYPVLALGEQLRVLAPGGELHLQYSRSPDGGQLRQVDRYWRYTGVTREPHQVLIENFKPFRNEDSLRTVTAALAAAQGIAVAVEFSPDTLHVIRH